MWSGTGEIDRLAHAVVDRPDDVDAVAADPVAHGDQVLQRVRPEGQVLQRPRRAGQGAVARMGLAQLDRDLVDVGQLDDREIAVLVHPQEGVQPSRHAVHVEQRHQRAAHHLGEEGDVFLDVPGHEGQVMDAGRLLGHGRFLDSAS
jgi:hypothetical protein